MNAVITRDFLMRPAVQVAPELLGMHLTHRSDEGSVTLRITEVEAYQGQVDPGSHAFRGPSPRNKVMFGEAGHLYTYRHLGLHTCVNIVCGQTGAAAAVLLRAGCVIEGHELARSRRRAAGVLNTDRDLARGPARLTVALGIGMSLSGADLCGPDEQLLLTPGLPVPRSAVSTGARVGVSGVGGDGEEFPWRFWLSDEPTVSEYRRAAPRGVPKGRI